MIMLYIIFVNMHIIYIYVYIHTIFKTGKDVQLCKIPSHCLLR